MTDTFWLIEQLLNHDLACLVSTHVLLSAKNMAKALEGRYRRDVLYLTGRNILYFIDLMTGIEDDARTPEGLYKFAVDDQEYLPTTCVVPANAVIWTVYQAHTGKVRDRTKRRPCWPSEYSTIINTPPHPPIPWDKVASVDRPWPYSPERSVKEAWGR